MTKTSRLIVRTAFLAVLALTVASPAEARYQQQGLFGGRQEPDGAVNVRNPIEPSRGYEAGISVAQRPRPEFDPTPIGLGSFQLFPSIELGALYDTNVYAQNSPTTDDFIYTVRPGFSLFSNWSRHAISFSGQADVGFYGSEDSEDFSDGVLSFRGRYDIRNQSYATYGADYQRLSENRTSPDTTLVAEPVTYNFAKFFGRIDHQQGKFNFRPEIQTRRYDFDPTNSASIPVISQDFRDRNQHDATMRVSYDLMRFWKPFVRGGYNIRDYESNTLRNSDGWHADLGTGFELSGGIITGEIYGGFQEQTYNNWNGNSVSDVISSSRYGGNILWNVTGMTSVEAEFGRSIEETTGAAYRGVLTDGGSLSVTHEIMRNLLGEVFFDATRQDFVGGPERVDEGYRVGTGMRYFFNRHLYGDIEYNYAKRSSDLDTAEFNKHLIGIRIGAQM